MMAWSSRKQVESTPDTGTWVSEVVIQSVGPFRVARWALLAKKCTDIPDFFFLNGIWGF